MQDVKMVNKFATIKERVSYLIEQKGITKEYFFEKIGMTSANFRGDAKKTPLNSTAIENIFTEFPDVSLEWLITGEGNMLRNKNISASHKNLIPLYDDVSSIGGMSSVTSMEGRSSTEVEWVDAGDWFKEATAAIRHYGDSMEEYPSGCILALKNINDLSAFIWGRDYVIETDEYRITKRIQKGKDHSHITAYSTNQETYTDGRLIHEPIDIPLDKIRRVALVLGYVVKKYSAGMVYTLKNT